ncbi:GTP pyrophosphokinase [Streptococcus moroccensis]|uniref:PpGpp synthetase/RelA/SpoT-type nucleotidyltransferase n=1 Tax=Streptococcus moroccensis TaxID=1451356 RepID=A0ABT9YRY2_9STRE|nr:GTP pyrophosphokinase family protein [Streptococcus moroccensis]MDQ0222525.1 ppGpp synthetase/RelA/SpoT-type nucleotidyltransferase [Streptococcus moroccensis]
MTQSIYGIYESHLEAILIELSEQLEATNKRQKEETGFKLFEHFLGRIKSTESMQEKCRRKGFPETTQAALKDIKDAIGIRLVTGFIDDIYRLVDWFKAQEGITIVREKDFITQAKPNGYRSYHLILEIERPHEDCLGHLPGKYFVEVQLRTIAMDSWASLEHQMKYKHTIKNPERLTRELKRCADELASCDLNMQTIRDLIEEDA